MSTWRQAVTAALAGTGRQNGQTGAGTAGADPERALLASLARHALRRRAGLRPRAGALPETAPAEPEQRPLAGDAAAARLGGLLAGAAPELVAEWLGLAAEAGVLVPPALLPDLLAHARTQPALREAVLPVLGSRGRWLAAQNPDWAFAAAADDPETTFRDGTGPARVEALRLVRAADAARGRELLAGTWAGESPAERARLVACLATGLGPDDEDFLEGAVRDGRREVRTAALDLLARLPGSRLVARMRERADACIHVRRGVLGVRLEVEPPAECDAGMVADGIERKGPAGLGQRAWWLSQVVARVPPGAWPVEALPAAARGDWAGALVRGWAAAAVRFGDAGWAEALLAWRARADRAVDLGVGPGELLDVLPPQRRDAVLLAALAERRSWPWELLAASKRQWSPELSQAVVTRLQKLDGQNLQVALLLAAYRCDPGVLPLAARLLAGEDGDSEAAARDPLRRAAGDFLATLQRRADMRRELTT